MKPFRANLISVLLLLGVTASSATAAWWWLAADRSQFYTDGTNLRAERESNAPRDVLWQPPEDVLTQDGARIDALDAHVMADESLMVLTRRSSRGDTDLYVSTRSDRGWSTPEPIDSVNSPDNELAPTLSPDGKRLLFASDRPGGPGGLDIWSSIHTQAGWTRPGPLTPTRTIAIRTSVPIRSTAANWFSSIPSGRRATMTRAPRAIPCLPPTRTVRPFWFSRLRKAGRLPVSP